MSVDLTDPVFTDEDKARTYFECIRWPHGPTCPHCGNADPKRIYSIAANPERGVRAGLRECGECGKQFTVRTRSVMESSHLPLTKWALAYRLMASSKKGISAHQMHRTLNISYKGAWFLCHRIREAMRDVSGDQLGGEGKIVEADETYVGGKPRKGKPRMSRMDTKTPVAVLIERGGRARATIVSHPLGGILKRNILANVARGTEMHTDEHKGYRGLDKLVGGPHKTVKHYHGEYARDGVHINSAEAWNSLLKRSIMGAFHHVSPEHLARYCDEVSFRWDRREMNDTDRAASAVKGGEGKRLTYRWPSRAQPATA